MTQDPDVLEEEIDDVEDVVDDLDAEPGGRPGDETAKKPIISTATIIWPVLLGLVVLSIIAFVTFDEAAYAQMWQSLNPWIMSGAGFCVLLRILVGGKRLSYVSHDQLSFKGGIRGQLAWDFAANITPSLVGGAPIAAYYIAQSTADESGKRIRMGEVTAFMMFIMLLDQTWFALSVPLILVSAVFMEVIPSSAGTAGSLTAVIYFLGFMGWTGIFAYATLFRPHLLAGITDQICRLPFLRKYRERVKHEMNEYQQRAGILRQQPLKFFARGLALTAGTWIARYALVVFIVWSFVPDVNQLLLFLRSIAMTIGSLVMPTPGGAGGIEALYVLFFGSMMPDAFLAPTLLIWRILGYYIFLGFGVFITTHHVKTKLRNRS